MAFLLQSPYNRGSILLWTMSYLFCILDPKTISFLQDCCCLISLSPSNYQMHLLQWVILISETYYLYFQFLNSKAPFKCPVFPSHCQPVWYICLNSVFISILVIHSSAHHKQESTQKSTGFTPVKLSDPLCFQIQTPHIQISQQNKFQHNKNDESAHVINK